MILTQNIELSPPTGLLLLPCYTPIPGIKILIRDLHQLYHGLPGLCLAVTPSLKSYGISGRGRLFEVKQRVKEANAGRQHDAPGRKLEGSSYLFSELQENPSLAIDFIIAPPRMAYYMEYSTRIYQVYMKYVAPEDIIVYSIDEVFMDVTDYLATYKLSPRDLAMKIILDVLSTTGITATAGIGTNLYLCKVAMDIVAKHIPADKNGVRIAELDEMSYRKTLWSHQPLTDFWRVGKGYAKKLEENGMFTMGDVARRSVTDEDLLYKLFDKNAELLIDHAWGWEPCTVEAVKAYKPESNSLGSGQVLHQPYEADKARLALREMADILSMDLVDRGFVTDQLVVTIGYDIENLTDPKRRGKYHGEVVKDHYGRQIPKHSHGTINLERYTSSTKQIMDAAGELFDRIADKSLLIRRLNIASRRNRLRLVFGFDLFQIRRQVVFADMDIEVFLLVESCDFAFTLHQHCQRRRLDAPDHQLLMIECREQPCAVYADNPIRLGTGKCGFVEPVKLAAASQMGKTLSDFTVFQRTDPQALERLRATGFLADQPENQFTLAPCIRSTDKLSYTLIAHEVTQHLELFLLVLRDFKQPFIRDDGEITVPPLGKALIVGACVRKPHKMTDAP